MNTLQAKESWGTTRAQFKQKLARLTGDDLQDLEEIEEELAGRNQRRTGVKKENVERSPKEVCASFGPE